VARGPKSTVEEKKLRQLVSQMFQKCRLLKIILVIPVKSWNLNGEFPLESEKNELFYYVISISYKLN